MTVSVGRGGELGEAEVVSTGLWEERPASTLDIVVSCTYCVSHNTPVAWLCRPHLHTCLVDLGPQLQDPSL